MMKEVKKSKHIICFQDLLEGNRRRACRVYITFYEIEIKNVYTFNNSMPAVSLVIFRVTGSVRLKKKYWCQHRLFFFLNIKRPITV